jgi:hypothetical protein
MATILYLGGAKYISSRKARKIIKEVSEISYGIKEWFSFWTVITFIWELG